MKTIKTIYYHIKGEPKAEDVGIGSTHENYIKAEVYYSEGGYSFFTYKNTPRAYFMSVHKIGRGKNEHGAWESVGVFSNGGAKMLLEEVKRQSKKKEAEAVSFFDMNIDDYVAKVFPELELEKEVS